MALLAFGVRITLAPKKRISLRRSTETLVGIVATKGYPLAAQTIAKPTPVLPLVASITVCPGFRAPLRSASSMMLMAKRSLTDPAGLKNSALTYRRTLSGASFFT